MSHRGQFASRTLDGILGEQVAGFGAQLAAHNLLIQAVVTEDAHMADVSLRTFLDAHLKVDGVTDDVHLCRLQVIEQVTVVPVVVAYGVFILRESLVHQFLVVDVAFLHAQCFVQVVAGDNGITYPRNVAQVVALSFIHLNVDVDMLLVKGPYRVL